MRDSEPEGKLGLALCLPDDEGRHGAGGLRTQGYFKSSLPNMPLITVVTVVFNGEKYLEETILSVINQTYKNVEYIIIDGGSTDATLDIIKKYYYAVDYWISEIDNGIYDAMNKGITSSNGEWLNFMNCGDSFYCEDVLSSIIYRYGESDLIYSDTMLSNGVLYGCNIHTNKIVHQSLIYKKNLHDEFGLYLNNKNVSISDYIFFQLCKKKKWVKSKYIIAIFNIFGVSSNLGHYKQKIAVDIIFGNSSRIHGVLMLLIHPIYIKVKRFFYET